MSEATNALRRALDTYTTIPNANTLAVVLDAARTVVTEAGSSCRYSRKRLFDSEESAVAGAQAIAERVGEKYMPLYPHPCPDGDHRHLTSAEQALGYCESCEQWVPCWRTKTTTVNVDMWILAKHQTHPDMKWTFCTGEGTYAAAIMAKPE